MTLPLAIRNHVAEMILGGFHDTAARECLRAMVRDDTSPHGSEVAERATRALRVLDGRDLDPPNPSLTVAIAQCALLFDAGLFFEVHEHLEPFWMRASGVEREALQGVIQIAVGFHHLGNGNLAGARALLHDGAAKLFERRVGGVDFDPFARAVADTLSVVVALGADGSTFDWRSVPRFPVRNETLTRPD